MTAHNNDDVDKYVHLISFVASLKNGSGIRNIPSDKITSFGIINQEKLTETECADSLRRKINSARRIQCLTDFAMNMKCTKDETGKQNCTLQYMPLSLYYRIKESDNKKYNTE